MKLANLMLQNLEFSPQIANFLSRLEQVFGIEVQIGSHHLVKILLLLQLSLGLLVFLLQDVDLRSFELDFFQ